MEFANSKGKYMNEEENESVATEEVVEAVAPATESEQLLERQEEAKVNKQRDDQAYNWAESRRKMQELERQIKERDEYLSQLKKQNTPVEEDDLDKLADDDIVTKGNTKKLIQKEARKIAEDIIKQHAASTVGERVKSKFADYDDVVNSENIELLKQKKPELARSLSQCQDPYDQAVAVYDALKMIGENVVNKVPVERDRALRNTQKPLSVNAVSKHSAIGNAHLFENGLTPELKSQLLKEMQEAARRS